jgi:hypothetical protein
VVSLKDCFHAWQGLWRAHQHADPLELRANLAGEQEFAAGVNAGERLGDRRPKRDRLPRPSPRRAPVDDDDAFGVAAEPPAEPLAGPRPTRREAAAEAAAAEAAAAAAAAAAARLLRDVWAVPEELAEVFSAGEVAHAKQQFLEFDADGSGAIDAGELRGVREPFKETRTQKKPLLTKAQLRDLAQGFLNCTDKHS